MIKFGLFLRDSRVFLSSISSIRILFVPIFLIIFSSDVSDGALFNETFSPSVSTQLFFLAMPIAGPKMDCSSFFNSFNFLGSSFRRLSNCRSGKPFAFASNPFSPSRR